MSSVLVQIKELSFQYGKNPAVLSDANLEIRMGEFLGIIGPNGSGKTTLLKLILGLLTPTSGTIQIEGRSAKTGRKIVGYVPQYNTASKNFPITVMDAVLMGRIGNASVFGPYGKKDRSHVSATLETLRISHLADRSLGSLSGGQMQRVLIARALVSDPKILLLDEPTANLDPQGEDDTYEILNSLRDQMGIVIVSHDVGFVSKYLDRVACVNQNIVIHEPSKLSKETLEKLYGHHVHAVIHEHEH